MEACTFSFLECEVLKKHRARLQRFFDVRICLPNLSGHNHSHSEDFTVKIEGEPRSIKYVQKFVKREMDRKASYYKKKSGKPPILTLKPQESIPIPVITIDEEDISETQISTNTRVIEKEEPTFNNHPSKNQFITSGSSSYVSNNKNQVSSCSSANQIVTNCSQTTNVASSPSCSENGSSNSPKNNQIADDSIVILSEVIVSSTFTNQDKASSVRKDSTKVNKPLPEFIPLRVRNVQIPCENNKKRKLIGKQCEPASKERRVLRPIVIDGSNVARFHGRPFNTFSCKGIKICVDYFLKRGHTDIKVLLPHFKRFISHGSVVTTDGELLDELEHLNMVVYTPSRRVNDRRITCYDDRFIVSLASQNNGVIVSNDNYRDLIMESAEFKKTIDERLLMFCFAGDIIMIPEDPLGSNGPSLTEFLSMRA